ncbi:potassium transporter [bacterium]|nr:potassium transporter [bacterium]
MDHSWLVNIFVFLLAGSVVVPLVGRFKLGSVLGYLVAGVMIGPFGLAFIQNPEQIMHFAEFGVVMMLFLIGMELEPEVLWRLRRTIVGLGGLQVVATSAVFALIGVMLGYDWRISLTCGMALSLSSTAIVLQMLQEKGLIKSFAGESSFAVLLFQDIAVIPILLIIPLLADAADVKGVNESLLSGFPAWLRAVIVSGVIASIVVSGKYFSRHVFRFIAKSNLREVFTATSLALVVGITLLMQSIGVSPALGAFLAGLVLANSEYRRTLETDIEPFKGLLLGLFFLSVGMSIDFGMFAAHPVAVPLAVLTLVLVKALVLSVLGFGFELRSEQNGMFALALAQGGEFAFVLFQYASSFNVLNLEQSGFLTLVVALSMALTPFCMMFNEKFLVPCFMSVLPDREFDTIEESNSVIIAGYGRFGQIIGRFLRGQGVPVTILEKDPDQIELLRKFGGRGYFGDASRLDLLQNAGADKATLLVVAVDDADKCLEIVKLAKENFPRLKVLARARNRRHAYELSKAGVDYFHRELFDSSLTMAQQTMIMLGYDPAKVKQKAKRFRQHDEKTLRESFPFFDKEPELISFARQASGELERILQEDEVDDAPALRVVAS